ncbi:MAG: response regulator [Chloracidobacterium sp.]|nr:response regulator [Chloracidobacterium sp.]
MTKPKLLLADDSVTIRKVVELTFTDEGLDVTTVANGEEAMQKFAEINPDIVIADVNMPEPTGYQICEMIKQNETTRHIPVLLVVGSFEPFDQAEAERVGADGFLTKPFQSIRDLISRVDELLGSQNRPALPIETADIDNLYKQSFSDTSDEEIDVNEFTDLVLGDAGMDDEIIEMSHPIGESLDQGFAVKSEVAVETVAEVDTTPPANGGVVMSFIKPPPAERIGDDNVVIKPMRRKTDFASAENSSRPDEPTEDFIAMIARRVVEKLSDKVIREIAKEEVPRITERLMREALDEEKKS